MDRFHVTGWGFTVYDEITGAAHRFDTEEEARADCNRRNAAWEDEIQRRAEEITTDA